MKAVICEECQTSYHLYCLASKLPPEATAAKCIECKKNVPLSVGDEANGANGSRDELYKNRSSRKTDSH